MEKQKSLTQFSDLTNTELTQVVGGNGWLDFLYRLSNSMREAKVTNHKLM